jgi:F0F1-type ATP synthase membrane subunit b/b'
MPQLILYALVGVAAWYGYKTIKKGMNNANDSIRKTEKKAAKKDGKALKPDPKTGVYKVTKMDKDKD